MNTKEKGNIGEAIIAAEFVKRGVQIAFPFGDNARYDLIAEFNGKLNKIQIKYSDEKIDKSGSIVCPTASSKNHTTNKKYSTYENDADYFAFYIKPWDKAVLVPISDVGTKKAITFRRDINKQKQKTMHFVDDYSFDKILCVETLHDEPKSD